MIDDYDASDEIEPTMKIVEDNRNATVTIIEYTEPSHYPQINFKPTSTYIEGKTKHTDKETNTDQPKVNF